MHQLLKTQFYFKPKKLTAVLSIFFFFVISNVSFGQSGNYVAGENAGYDVNNVPNGGSSNTFVGNFAGSRALGATNNTFLGFSAGIWNVSALGNTFIGRSSGRGVENIPITGNYNTFTGHNSGLSISSGSDNAFFGRDAGRENSQGSKNTFIGVRAGWNNNGSSSFASSNTFIGYYSGSQNRNGTRNTFIGRNSGWRHEQGSYNTFLGSYAGNNHVTGERNVFLGYGAGYRETGSHRLHIASDSAYTLIYGEFDNRRVGINTTSPTATLHVNGGLRIGGTDVANPGTIRWSGNDFEGYDGSEWTSLTSGGDAGGNQTLNLAGATLSISDGNNVDLTALRNTARISSISLNAANSLRIIEGGVTRSVSLNRFAGDTDPENEAISKMTLANNQLTITEGADATINNIDLSPLAITNLELNAANELLITEGNGDNQTVTSVDLSNLQGGGADADADPNNETITDLRISGKNLEITEAGVTQSVDLSAFVDDDARTDNEVITSIELNAANELVIKEAGVAKTVDLSALAGGEGDADADPNNETISAFQLNGNNLEIIEAGVPRSVDLSALVGGGGGNAGWRVDGNDVLLSEAGNIGIGTVDPPEAKLQVEGGDVYFVGDDQVGGIVNPGYMRWYSNRSAFRAGNSNGNWVTQPLAGGELDNGDNVGFFSFGVGYGSVATGTYSAAFGSQTTASGTSSTAYGSSTTAEGDYSVSYGSGSEAIGNYAVTFGESTIARSYSSVVMGRYNVRNNAFNSEEWIDTDPLFVIGNGNGQRRDPDQFSNALTVLKNGNVGVGTADPEQALDVAGNVQAVEYLNVSDARYKKDIRNVSNAFEALKNIRGVNYKFNTDKFAGKKFSNTEQYGFLAQEIQNVFPELVHENKEGYLSVNYIGLIPVLTEALKEVKAESDERLSMLEKEIEDLKAGMANLKSEVRDDQIGLETSQAQLFQNKPNPFTESTEINFSLPMGSQKAMLYIYDLQGKQVNEFEITDKQKSVELKAGELQAGMYLYSLIVDGDVVDTKRMILTR